MKRAVFLHAARGCFAILALSFCLSFSPAFADGAGALSFSLTTAGAWYPKSAHQRGGSHFAPVTGAYDGLKASLTWSADYTLPCLQGRGPLTAGNHASCSFDFELTPLSVAPSLSLTVSPLAFLELAAGAKAGTGWSLGEDLQGLAAFTRAKPQYEDLAPAESWYLYGWVSASLMFDTGSIWEGDWHHLLALASYKAGYQKMTGCGGRLWGWQTTYAMADGWVYEQKYLLGYQLPLRLSLLAVGMTFSGHYRGSDYGEYDQGFDGAFMRVEVWPAARISVSERDGLFLLADFTSRRSFRERYVDTAGEPLMTVSGREWLFYYLALQWSHRF